MFINDDFMNFMGYRNNLVEEKIEECLAAVRRGATSISIDAKDLTADEIEYLKNEVHRRIQSGNY